MISYNAFQSDGCQFFYMKTVLIVDDFHGKGDGIDTSRLLIGRKKAMEQAVTNEPDR